HKGDIISYSGGTFFVDESVLAAWESAGGPTGFLGLPIEDTPSPGNTTIARTQQFQAGAIRTFVRNYTILQPPPNTNGPTRLFLHSGEPDTDGNFPPNQVLSATKVGMTWWNNDPDPGTTTTVY